MLRLTQEVHTGMVAHAIRGLPLEACGLLVGTSDNSMTPHGEADCLTFVPTENEAASSKLYTVPAKAMLRTDRNAEDNGHQIIGVMHSHTHTDPYPSPTDVAQAPDPTWHYVIVSLRQGEPSLRSFRIIDGNISEERVVVEVR